MRSRTRKPSKSGSGPLVYSIDDLYQDGRDHGARRWSFCCRCCCAISLVLILGTVAYMLSNPGSHAEGLIRNAHQQAKTALRKKEAGSPATTASTTAAAKPPDGSSSSTTATVPKQKTHNIQMGPGQAVTMTHKQQSGP